MWLFYLVYEPRVSQVPLGEYILQVYMYSACCTHNEMKFLFAHHIKILVKSSENECCSDKSKESPVYRLQLQVTPGEITFSCSNKRIKFGILRQSDYGTPICKHLNLHVIIVQPNVHGQATCSIIGWRIAIHPIPMALLREHLVCHICWSIFHNYLQCLYWHIMQWCSCYQESSSREVMCTLTTQGLSSALTGYPRPFQVCMACEFHSGDSSHCSWPTRTLVENWIEISGSTNDTESGIG